MFLKVWYKLHHMCEDMGREGGGIVSTADLIPCLVILFQGTISLVIWYQGVYHDSDLSSYGHQQYGHDIFPCNHWQSSSGIDFGLLFYSL